MKAITPKRQAAIDAYKETTGRAPPKSMTIKGMVAKVHRVNDVQGRHNTFVHEDGSRFAAESKGPAVAKSPNMGGAPRPSRFMHSAYSRLAAEMIDATKVATAAGESSTRVAQLNAKALEFSEIASKYSPQSVPASSPATASPRTVSRAVGRIGRAGMSAVPKLALGIAAAGAAFAAYSRSAEAGESQTSQVKSGAIAGGRSAVQAALVQTGIIAADRALARSVPSLAVHGARALVGVAKFGMPALGLAFAAYGAYKGYQQGGVKGAAIGALTGGYVPAAMRTPAAASAPVPPFGPIAPAPMLSIVTAPDVGSTRAPVSGAHLNDAAAARSKRAEGTVVSAPREMSAAKGKGSPAPTKMVNGREVSNPWFTARDRMKAFGHAGAA